MHLDISPPSSSPDNKWLSWWHYKAVKIRQEQLMEHTNARFICKHFSLPRSPTGGIRVPRERRRSGSPEPGAGVPQPCTAPGAAAPARSPQAAPDIPSLSFAFVSRLLLHFVWVRKEGKHCKCSCLVQHSTKIRQHFLGKSSLTWLKLPNTSKWSQI